eukprot:6187472-Pleurochrysis_carterae.AAC.4
MLVPWWALLLPGEALRECIPIHALFLPRALHRLLRTDTSFHHERSRQGSDLNVCRVEHGKTVQPASASSFVLMRRHRDHARILDHSATALSTCAMSRLSYFQRVCAYYVCRFRCLRCGRARRTPTAFVLIVRDVCSLSRFRACR